MSVEARRSQRPGADRGASRRALRIATLYAPGMRPARPPGWIVTSDRVLGLFTDSPATLVRLSQGKGAAFVLTTSVLLYLLLPRTFAALAREHQLGEALLRVMPGVLFVQDEAGRMLLWNQELERVTGHAGAALARLQPLDLFAQSDRPLLRGRMTQALGQGEAAAEADLMTGAGTRVPCLLTGRRVTLNGRACLVGVGVDLSTRRLAERALRQSEERLRSTLDTAIEGFQLLDFEWRYLYLNAAAERQNRRPSSELLGRRMLEAWPGMERTEVFAMLKRCMTERTPEQAEVEFSFPDGHTGWFDVRAQPVPEGIFILSIDVSERKHAELSLKALNDELERKVAQRTLELALAVERAESADRVKSAFLATMSHELRTPLNSILGFTGIVLGELAGPLSGEQKRQLGMVQTSARHLLDLINDVLDISKIEAGQLEPHPAPFDLLNLVSNAVKFTEAGRVTVRVDWPDGKATTQGDSDSAPPWVHVHVSDTGIGIAAEDLPKLFQPFRQIDSGLQRKHEGTGLGLAISRRLAELLGGTVSVESHPGQGSRFTLKLPLTNV